MRRFEVHGVALAGPTRNQGEPADAWFLRACTLMTEADARIKLTREIEKAVSEYGIAHKPGLAVFIASKILKDIPGVMEAVKDSARGAVR